MHVILASEASVLASQTLFALALIVIAGPLLAEKARLPGLIGFMIGGTILGPFVLGFLDTGQFDAIGGLGVLYLMFLAGLELDMDIFNRYRASAARFGLLTFAIPFGLGWWLAAAQLGYSTASSILLGSIWASHTLVALPIVKRAGLSGSRTAAMAAGATIITDTLALVVLAIISSGAADEGDGGRGGTLLMLIGGLAALVFATLWVYPRVGKWFFAGPGTDRSLRFMFLLGAMALAGLLSEAAGIEGIVGAFFAGLGLNRLVPERSNLMDKVEFVGSALFIPAFLISVGMLIDPALLFDWETLRLAGAFLAIVAVGKAAAAVIGGRVLRFSFAEIGLLFSLTIGQAAATLAAALVGASIGLFDDQTINAAVLAVLVTVLLSSILTRVFTGLVEPDKTLLQAVGSAVVIPINDVEGSGFLLNLAGQISLMDSGTVTPLLVLAPDAAGPEVSVEAEGRVEAAAERVRSGGAEAEGLVRVDGSATSAVLNVVAEKRASMVILPGEDTGSTLSGMVFGGPIESIGGQSPVPVMLAVRIQARHRRLVVIVPGRPRTAGDQVDLQVGLDVARRIQRALAIPLVALIGHGATVPDLPDGASIARGLSTDPEDWGQTIQAGDLVVAPLTSVRRFLRGRSRDALLPPDIGLLITAGPFRMRSEGTGAEEVSAVFGYGKR